MNAILRFLQCEDGPAAVEYAVMLALIIGTAITSIGSLGGANGALWGNIESETTAAFDAAHGVE
jgi:Flp pilus assembly pilin Flp